MADRHQTPKCYYCQETMRSDHYERHMRTSKHVKMMVKHMLDRKQVKLEERPVVVYHKTVTPTTEHYRILRYDYAICLVCGDSKSCVGGKRIDGQRYEYDEGHAPVMGNKQPTCAAEEWIESHNTRCGYGYDKIKDWYDCKPVPIPDRKKKEIAKPVKTTKAAKEAKEAKPAEPTPVYDDRVARDAIARQFPKLFEYYFYDDEQAEEEMVSYERDEQRAMTFEEMLGLIATKLNEAELGVENQKEQVKKAVTKSYENQLRTKDKEYQELEREVIALRGEIEILKNRF